MCNSQNRAERFSGAPVSREGFGIGPSNTGGAGWDRVGVDPFATCHLQMQQRSGGCPMRL